MSLEITVWILWQCHRFQSLTHMVINSWHLPVTQWCVKSQVTSGKKFGVHCGGVWMRRLRLLPTTRFTTFWQATGKNFRELWTDLCGKISSRFSCCHPYNVQIINVLNNNDGKSVRCCCQEMTNVTMEMNLLVRSDRKWFQTTWPNLSWHVGNTSRIFVFAVGNINYCHHGRGVNQAKQILNGVIYTYTVQDIFCSFIIIFTFVVPCLHQHLGAGEWMYGCWVEA